MKNNSYGWLWKWHFIGGIISLPIVVLLAITGIIYLFKDNYEQPKIEKLKTVTPLDQKLSYQAQYNKLLTNVAKPNKIVLSKNKTQATEFQAGKHGATKIFVNPYNGKITAQLERKNTDMYLVRKLHGELLLGKFGTMIVELVASWMVVLILSGLILFSPRGRGIKAFFSIRTNNKGILFRDLHAVSGFWFSLVILTILFGGLPWTDVWGGGFKWVQNQTSSGFPSSWSSSEFQSGIKESDFSLDDMVKIAEKLNLEGKTSISFPKNSKGVYSVFNDTHTLKAMKMLHYDQYSGKLIIENTWKDIGIMMRSRLWLMAFHQGEFGFWNLLLVIITALGLVLMSIAAILSYITRKKSGSLTIPVAYKNSKASSLMVLFIIILGAFLPLFGISILLIYLISKLRSVLIK